MSDPSLKLLQHVRLITANRSLFSPEDMAGSFGAAAHPTLRRMGASSGAGTGASGIDWDSTRPRGRARLHLLLCVELMRYMRANSRCAMLERVHVTATDIMNDLQLE